MTATLSTRMEIESLGPGEIELSLDYEYSHRHRELMIHNCFADINGTEIEVWHKLSQTQRGVLEERCVDDYNDRMMGVVAARYEELRAW